MANYVAFLILVMIASATAKPFPDYGENGQEILKGADTRYYGLPSFWYQRPFRESENEDYGVAGGGYNRPPRRHHESKLPVYESVGAGWGR